MHVLKLLLKHENWKNEINAYYFFFKQLLDYEVKCWSVNVEFYKPTFTLKILNVRL